MNHVHPIPGHVAASVKPVVLDQTGRRWRLRSVSLNAFAVLALVGACRFATGMFHPPLFPRIKVDDARVREQNESRNQTVKGTLLKTAFATGNADVPALCFALPQVGPWHVLILTVSFHWTDH